MIASRLGRMDPVGCLSFGVSFLCCWNNEPGYAAFLLSVRPQLSTIPPPSERPSVGLDLDERVPAEALRLLLVDGPVSIPLRIVFRRDPGARKQGVGTLKAFKLDLVLRRRTESVGSSHHLTVAGIVRMAPVFRYDGFSRRVTQSRNHQQMSLARHAGLAVVDRDSLACKLRVSSSS